MLLRAIGLGPNLVNTEDSFCTQMGGLLEFLLGSENKCNRSHYFIKKIPINPSTLISKYEFRLVKIVLEVV